MASPCQGKGPAWEAALRLLGRSTAQPCYVLGIDQASRSGWAMHDFTRVIAHGYTNTSVQRRAALKALGTKPAFDMKRLLVVFEDHSTMPITRNAVWSRDPVTGKAKAPTRSTGSILGMGEARGRWEELLDILEHPRHQRIDVEPREWRRVLGVRINLNTEAWKQSAKFWATVVAGERIEDDNEAEAMAIAQWGAIDGVMRWARTRTA